MALTGAESLPRRHSDCVSQERVVRMGTGVEQLDILLCLGTVSH
jgi:hypothetical protein